MLKELDKLVKQVHKLAVDKGWWDDGASRNTAAMFALMHSEVSEALEEYRNGQSVFYIKDGKPEGIGIELADVCIRIMDYLGSRSSSFERVYLLVHALHRKRWIEGRDARHLETFPMCVMMLHNSIQDAFHALNNTDPEDQADVYQSYEEAKKKMLGIVAFIDVWFEQSGLSLEEAIKEKHKYNETRPIRHGGKVI